MIVMEDSRFRPMAQNNRRRCPSVAPPARQLFEAGGAMTFGVDILITLAKTLKPFQLETGCDLGSDGLRHAAAWDSASIATWRAGIS